MVEICWCTKLLNTAVTGIEIHRDIDSSMTTSLTRCGRQFYIESQHHVFSDTSAGMAVQINYCPFCGKKLSIEKIASERLTYESNIDGIADVGLHDNTKQGINDAVVKLCDYENTGLTPEEVKVLKYKMFVEKKVKNFTEKAFDENKFSGEGFEKLMRELRYMCDEK